MNRYRIDTPNFTTALVALVEAFKGEAPSVGTFRAKLHDGPRVTIVVGDKNPRAAKGKVSP